ncbi:MAG: type IX secretion system protein PorQ [Bacteroidaceae bacterium]|nr:type IX secretion system protein PorQ [Bacteroidaceae bacterium]
MTLTRLLGVLLALALLPASSSAQGSSSVFDFLNLPTSSHAMALGGKNLSLIEDDASLIFQNPALMSSVSDKTLNLNFLTYMQGSKAGNISYVQAQGERGTWSAMAQFVGYGDMDETDSEGNIIGTERMLDMNISGGYSYLLSDRWAGGVSGKFLYSYYAGYSSIALAVDLGLNYYNSDKDFSFSVVAANLGGQVSAFGEIAESLPMDLQLGLSKGLGQLPVRVHLTFYDMFRWSKDYYYNPDGNLNGFQIFLNHLNLGADITLYQGRFWLGLGYNFRRGQEMKAGGSSHAAGLTLGAGINIKKLKLGVAYGNYHIGAPTLSFTLAYSFAKEKKNTAKNTITQTKTE